MALQEQEEDEEDEDEGEDGEEDGIMTRRVLWGRSCR